jgi:phage baseplate assembly protein gpV
MRAPHERSDEQRQIAGMVRTGRVSSTDKNKHTARVEFADDGEDQLSYDLQILVTRPGDYSLIAPGALVACLFVPGSSGDGFILGALYNDEDAPPADDDEVRVIEGEDLRLGASNAIDKVALAAATKDEIQKALDYANGIATAIMAGVVVAQDGGASLKATIIAALPILPNLDEPAAQFVSAK